MADVDDDLQEHAALLAAVSVHAAFVCCGNKVLDVVEDAIDLTLDDAYDDDGDKSITQHSDELVPSTTEDVSPAHAGDTGITV